MNELKQLEEKELLEILHTNKTLLISLIDEFKSNGFRIPEEVLSLKDNVGRSERMSDALSKRLTTFISKNEYKRVAVVNFAIKEFLDKYEGIERIESPLRERELSPFQKEALNYIKGFQGVNLVDVKKNSKISLKGLDGAQKERIRAYIKELSFILNDDILDKSPEEGIYILIARNGKELDDYFKE